MTPEEKARVEIDKQLKACGWDVQDKEHVNLQAAHGVAVREFPLLQGYGHADYMMFVDGKAISPLEAKPEGHTLTGVEVQSAKYLKGLPPGIPRWKMPLPFAYESTGVETRFTNFLDPEPRSRQVFTFHRPDCLLE